MSTPPTNTLYPRFSESEFSRRYAAVRARMQEVGLSALVLYGTVSAYDEVLYLSNFPVTREAMLVFPVNGEPTLFVQMYNHVPNARQIACVTDVRWGGPDTAIAAASNLQERGLAESSIGLVGMIPIQRYESFKDALPQVTLVTSCPGCSNYA